MLKACDGIAPPLQKAKLQKTKRLPENEVSMQLKPAKPFSGSLYILQPFRPAAQPDSRVKLSAQAAVVHGKHAVEAFGQLFVVGNHDQGGAQLVFELQHHFQRVGGVFAV